MGALGNNFSHLAFRTFFSEYPLHIIITNKSIQAS